MQFDERWFKPSSTRELLYQQVEEQSDICDVTIQVGQWKKKFHWCVLVVSPFFECIWRSDFIEKQTGLVKLNTASPLATETAILFLYGKRPKLTEGNVEAVLQLSEFLLIPNLKSACVAFLKECSTREDNCLKMLEISSLYEVEISHCYDYIRGHLHDILKTEEAGFLTKEYVLTLLTDPVLSYVSHEDKFNFIIRWANTSQQNKDALFEVLEVLDLSIMNSEFVKTTVLQHPLVTQIIDSITLLDWPETQRDHQVLIFPGSSVDGRVECFDLESERWCGIETWQPEDGNLAYSITRASIEGTLGPRIVYRVVDNCDVCKICSQDLHSKEYTIKTMTMPDSKQSMTKFSAYDVTTGVFVAALNKTMEQFGRLWPGVSNVAFNFESAKSVKGLRHYGMYKETTTLFCGYLNQPETILYPLFTLRNTKVDSVCINDSNYIALFEEVSSTLHIYDMSNGIIDTISLTSQFNPGNRYMYGRIQVKAKEDGFIIHVCEMRYDTRFMLNITRLHGPALTERYAVQKTELGLRQGYEYQRYVYSNKTWFRFLKKSWESKVEFACVSHDALVNDTDKEITWKQLPSPNEGFKVSKEVRAFIMELPKSMLCCHYDCPHCEQLKQQIAKKRHASSPRKTYVMVDVDEYFYDDSDDDSYEGYQG